GNTGMSPLATVARDTIAVDSVVVALGHDARACDTRRLRFIQRTRQTTNPAVTEIRLEIDTQLAATRPVACILARARRRRSPSAGSPDTGATSTSPGASPDGPQSSRTPRAGVVASSPAGASPRATTARTRTPTSIRRGRGPSIGTTGATR